MLVFWIFNLKTFSASSPSNEVNATYETVRQCSLSQTSTASCVPDVAQREKEDQTAPSNIKKIVTEGSKIDFEIMQDDLSAARSSLVRIPVNSPFDSLPRKNLVAYRSVYRPNPLTISPGESWPRGVGSLGRFSCEKTLIENKVVGDNLTFDKPTFPSKIVGFNKDADIEPKDVEEIELFINKRGSGGSDDKPEELNQRFSAKCEALFDELSCLKDDLNSSSVSEVTNSSNTITHKKGSELKGLRKDPKFDEIFESFVYHLITEVKSMTKKFFADVKKNKDFEGMNVDLYQEKILDWITSTTKDEVYSLFKSSYNTHAKHAFRHDFNNKKFKKYLKRWESLVGRVIKDFTVKFEQKIIIEQLKDDLQKGVEFEETELVKKLGVYFNNGKNIKRKTMKKAIYLLHVLIGKLFVN